jgi:hypothetical protein
LRIRINYYIFFFILDILRVFFEDSFSFSLTYWVILIVFFSNYYFLYLTPSNWYCVFNFEWRFFLTLQTVFIATFSFSSISMNILCINDIFHHWTTKIHHQMSPSESFSSSLWDQIIIFVLIFAIIHKTIWISSSKLIKLT